MSTSFDLYVPRDSALHRTDPRVKLWAALLGIMLCLALQSIPALAIALLGVNALLLSAGVPWNRVRWVWARMTPITVLILSLQPWFAPSGGTWLALGPLALTAGGVHDAVRFAVRANALAFMASLPLLTTPQDMLVRGLVRLGMPYTWGLTVSLALRYLPTAHSLFTTIEQAQEARGHITGRGHVLARARSFVPVLVATIIASLRLSDQLSMTIAARGLARGTRTSLYDIAMTRADWGAAAGVTLVFGAALALRLAGVFV
ncbi:MAG: energy-coupling factor transporter transmembrane protein EcfT [Anaerolineae bacterium]|nr:energy-coupling factor transporter transmembrane protein EcfT [Anaerolineae bacterium]